MDKPPSEFAHALEALAKPLRFASRNNFQHLDKVKGLEATLQAAVQRARRSAPSVTHRRGLQEFSATLPDPAEPRDTRVAKLRRCIAVMEALEAAPPQGFGGLGESRNASPNDGTVSAPRMSRGSPGGATGREPGAENVPDGEKPAPANRVGAPSTRIIASLETESSGPILELDAEVQYIKGVGPRLGSLLRQKGLTTVQDLLRFLPRRYECRQGQRAICQLEAGGTATVEGEVVAVSAGSGRGRKLEVALADPTGVMHLVWFRVPGRGYAERFAKGARVRATGAVKRFRGRMQMVHPETAIAGKQPEQATIAEPSIVAVYPEIEGFRPPQFRRVIERVLPSAHGLSDPLPEVLRSRRGLPALAESIVRLHRPPGECDVQALERGRSPWHERLIYEELFVLQLAVLHRRAQAARASGIGIEFAVPLLQEASALFPFALTEAQQRVLAELEEDLRRPSPANRLLQGDVGSGKTAVALTLALGVAKAGFQTAVMAPTEILAEQHARTALKILAPTNISMALLTSSVGAARRREVLETLATGELQVLFGTHSVIQEDVRFARLALGIVDEQHRFGVMQRARVLELGQQSTGLAPHMVVMTATPIPRTLALTAYGDLDVSTIDTMPPGREPVKTRLFKDKQRAQVMQLVRQAVQAGRQAFIVFPLVEASDKDGMEDVRAATDAAAELSTQALAGLRVGLLHGKMHSDEKDAVMRAFAAGALDVLVATTVVEVGIDVPNATVMVVEHAERFGLSQLHQLRGRVGRGQHRSFCYLIAGNKLSQDAWRRLKIMEDTNDGFRIAEEDLAIRGPGDFMGTRQSGLPLLTVANLARDQDLLIAARADAKQILSRDPDLSRPEHQGLRVLKDAWAERLALARVG